MQLMISFKSPVKQAPFYLTYLPKVDPRMTPFPAGPRDYADPGRSPHGAEHCSVISDHFSAKHPIGKQQRRILILNDSDGHGVHHEPRQASTFQSHIPSEAGSPDDTISSQSSQRADPGRSRHGAENLTLRIIIVSLHIVFYEKNDCCWAASITANYITFTLGHIGDPEPLFR
ncbi:hypothetical protein Hypma_000618 [Hypsizygus marmoreus]|uniref:Uncharacterized protein n=1 Tax=Hypsizygus marmoreus TaxID=39966 RepID=A0A369JFE4_HYPMA|nr:hypothetical protein Hypma_000618 [Hypsizygus marmoreus]